MRPVLNSPSGVMPDPRAQPRALGQLALALVATVLVMAAVLTSGYLAFQRGTGLSPVIPAAGPPAADASGSPDAAAAGSNSTTSSTTVAPTSTSAPPTSVLGPAPAQEAPPLESRFVVPPSEAEPQAKQIAADIAYSLTTYGASDDHLERLSALAGSSEVQLLAEASEPLIYAGSWSRGQVIYPQLAGLTDDRASVMVVTRQAVGSGSEAEFSVVRTLDIRLVLGESGWEFDQLSSAGGTFASLEDLALAHEVANDPRIEMPDSARLDIQSGLVSPILLEVMAELADLTPYGVVAAATGHPEHVFGTERVSHHTIGRAIDIYRVGDRLVIDDRGADSETRALVEWLYDHSSVEQVGAPWDLDVGEDEESRRSFTDAVHEDHIHLAVIEGS